MEGGLPVGRGLLLLLAVLGARPTAGTGTPLAMREARTPTHPSACWPAPRLLPPHTPTPHPQNKTETPPQCPAPHALHPGVTHSHPLSHALPPLPMPMPQVVGAPAELGSWDASAAPGKCRRGEGGGGVALPGLWLL